ncbi:hypothetical protein FDUTEX481_01467 [Tolypothrix sp. PCC 7601]|nr:hypothetical protein FDUTEX481_01467 [Tolypothrix sp. PCC 7601]
MRGMREMKKMREMRGMRGMREMKGNNKHPITHYPLPITKCQPPIFVTFVCESGNQAARSIP